MRPTRSPVVISVPIHNSRNENGTCCCCGCCNCINLGFLKTGPGKLKLAEVVIGFFCQSLALQYGSNYSGTIGLSFQSFVTNVTWCFLTTFLLLICYLFSPKSINLIKSSLFIIGCLSGCVRAGIVFFTAKCSCNIACIYQWSRMPLFRDKSHAYRASIMVRTASMFFKTTSVRERRKFISGRSTFVNSDSRWYFTLIICEKKEEVLFNVLAALTYLGTCSYLGYIVNIVLEPLYMVTPHYQVYPAMSAAYVAGSILGIIYAYDAYKSYRYFKGYRY